MKVLGLSALSSLSCTVRVICLNKMETLVYRRIQNSVSIKISNRTGVLARVTIFSQTPLTRVTRVTRVTWPVCYAFLCLPWRREGAKFLHINFVERNLKTAFPVEYVCDFLISIKLWLWIYFTRHHKHQETITDFNSMRAVKNLLHHKLDGPCGCLNIKLVHYATEEN